ncbi:hypothetical protein N658DRAFT_276016 [Parathielavia hyrcaniae]|uniref:Zn(2)-C6 fungal-type domain-containing protein n=1 Tax=Parathielavia hyrcaniae TaxID=113614 RepID=A0AAN6Q4Q7_9PEZI|nr:hypothetical protein N658DRAFT_276016 [Parathielavia hyrcaniae]
MERPAPQTALGRPPPALASVSATAAVPAPSSAAGSTICVSPAVTGSVHHHHLRHSHPLPQQLSVGDAPVRREPKRAARGEIEVAEESPELWTQAAAAKAARDGLNGQGPGLGASPEDRDSSTASPTASTDHPRKKQKRNKPTLSCFECVERKTKCDRGRPHCLACIKRQTECQYAHVANLLE